ncbi:hypothetical protein EIM50_23840 [Pseudoxanthomonas sp. SGD-10]|nr:hypothetical protein EIM50_23840 [Pseudoxanthomonas sp. SGD-10]
MKKFNEIDFFLSELKQIQANGESLSLLKEHLYNFHLLGLLIEKGKINEALDTAENYEKLFSNKIIAPNSSAAMHFRLAVLFFINSNYTASLKLVNKVLNTSGKYISTQQYTLGRMLHLLIHLELGNDDYLHYEIKSVERKLKNAKKLFTLEKITLQFLKRWLIKQERVKVLKDFEQALIALEENGFENQLLSLFPFKAWVRSRILKVSLKDFIKEAQI